MNRVERHIVLNDKNIDELCFKSKNLYNYCNYILRQNFLDKSENIQSFKHLTKTFKIQDKEYKKIDEYDLSKFLSKINQQDYRALPTNVAQQIIKLLYRNWKAFFKSIKVYHKDKMKFLGKPNLPKYKHKEKGRNIVVFTTNVCRVKKGFIHFAKKSNLQPLRTKVDNLQQVRIIPQATCYIIEVVYRKEVQRVEVNPNTYLSIDIGLNNLATCVNNIGLNSFIINGKPLKSINQYYNKMKALYQSYIGDKGTSNRIKRLTFKRNCKVEDYIHKTSRFIVNYCVEHKISKIVIGKNDRWKQNISIGKKNNQNFVSIPFARLIKKIQYKAEDVGIEVILTEESYTSKCSFLDLESLKKHVKYLGKRVQRGLFKSSKGILINADVNGAGNILRKVVPNVFDTRINGIEGIVVYPSIVSLQ